MFQPTETQFAKKRWLAVHHLVSEDMQVKYQELLIELIMNNAKDEVSGECYWSALKVCTYLCNLLLRRLLVMEGRYNLIAFKRALIS